MGKPRFSEAQIAHALELVESGMPIGKVCRQLVVSEGGLYNWRRKFRGQTARAQSRTPGKPRVD